MIELLVLDVDGCLSDGKITYTAQDDEIKSFNVKDGLAISTWIKMGRQVAIITGRDSKIVARRAKELNIQHLFQGVSKKIMTLDVLVEELGLDMNNVAAMGDDLNDFKMLEMVGRSFTPNDGVREIRNLVDTVVSKRGGDGAVREMIEMIIDEENLNEEFLSFWV